MNSQSTSAYAQLNAKIMPIARGEQFETPLEAALDANGLGAVGGGGTMQLKTGEIEYCGIDVDLFDIERGAAFVCEFLTDRGAPKGSKLLFERHGENVEMPFGRTEGLAIYLNGTDLAEEVYRQSDVNVVIDTIDRLLGSRGSIQGYWQGPTETALYLYGDSADDMRQTILEFMSEYPLCQGARIVRIA